MNARVRRKLARRKRRIQKRLNNRDLRDCAKPMFTASNIQYEFGERGRGIGYGGIGALQFLVRKLGFAEAKDALTIAGKKYDCEWTKTKITYPGKASMTAPRAPLAPNGFWRSDG